MELTRAEVDENVPRDRAYVVSAVDPRRGIVTVGTPATRSSRQMEGYRAYGGGGPVPRVEGLSAYIPQSEYASPFYGINRSVSPDNLIARTLRETEAARAGVDWLVTAVKTIVAAWAQSVDESSIRFQLLELHGVPTRP